ncbi:hypothetical protein ACUHMQ_17600 [Chitinimonas sp. PSY-7]|uniref:hypothetical protein n=1 Tax=Chitinimonas sp. PSY-7 TaxID=3459088 RepID=UPI00403FDDD6
MGTVRLNKSNDFCENITVNNGVTEITFLVNGSNADCIVYANPGPNVTFVGEKKNVTSGNIATFKGITAGASYKVQINPLGDTKLANATVSY